MKFQNSQFTEDRSSSKRDDSDVTWSGRKVKNETKSTHLTSQSNDWSMGRTRKQAL